MPQPVVKRLVWLGGALAAIAVAVLVILPYVASTQIVRDRIAQELSNWTGYQVSLGAETSIDVWPVVTAQLRDVTFSEFGGDGRPVARIERIDAALAALPALSGRIVFTQLRLLRPTISFSAGGTPSPRPRGRIAEALAVAREIASENAAEPDTSRLPSDALPGIEIVEGKLTILRDGAATELLSAVSGRLAWPALNRSASIAASGIWRGELVDTQFETAQPLLMLVGAAAPLTLQLESAPLNLNFSGAASLDHDGFLQGQGTFVSPSLRRMLEWSGNDITPGSAIGAVSIKAKVSGSLHRINLSEASVTLDGNASSGTLEIATGDKVPTVSGTLAFDTINLQSFLSAFSALTPDRWGRYSTIDGQVAEQLNLDLRLSADVATAGSLNFTEVAATAQINGGLAAFDISDARAFDGMVQAGFRIDQPNAASRVEVRLRGVGIDLGALARTMQVSYLMPIARGDLAIALRGDGNDWVSIMRTAQGSFSANLGPGAMAGVDLDAFAEKAHGGEFFPLSEASGGTLTFDSLALKAKVEKGVARLQRAEVTSGNQRVELSGLVPLPGRGLALTGTIDSSAEADEKDAQRMQFFIGGSWESPYVSPVIPPIAE